ncbi:flagellar protein FliS [Planomonospora parontospora subsp. parontospora]|uniref:Flagellar protein FliS n=2 Tax=Planomonospora parontospora TaxID=58119 RepID=A0AA37F8E5_9ACTN|nr:flagellar export chaperone FliS [Planomonospora parontospora]GGL01052.1 flagellar protein FliS [Planomonospora parontospora]GII13177.1 flagellar protein FliS [Planomonospora parontospora subsp. parontospora]
MNNPSMRARYMADAVTTASPGKLLVMLYDRLVLDLVKAEEALGRADRETASAQLQHAQEIVIELRSSLRMDVWEGAKGLSELYGFLLTQLIQANVRRDAAQVVSCRALVEPLRDAWRTAVAEAGTVGAAARVA